LNREENGGKEGKLNISSFLGKTPSIFQSESKLKRSELFGSPSKEHPYKEVSALKSNFHLSLNPTQRVPNNHTLTRNNPSNNFIAQKQEPRLDPSFFSYQSTWQQ
jgi:hypothetical protein